MAKAFVPAYPGEFPTLGHYVIEWMTEMLAMPGKNEFRPFLPTREQAEFLLQFYRLDPVTGERIRRRAVLSRPKGWGKSPFLSAIAAAEGLADVVFDGWDANGRPVGKPWSSIMTPLINFLAVSEKQTDNAWSPMLEMLREGPVLDAYRGLEPLGKVVFLPKGRMEPRTAAAKSYEGTPTTFVVMDQTESWTPGNRGVELAAVARRNLGKTNGTSIEAPNAFEPGAGSVAEASAKYWADIQSGLLRDPDGFYYDHREWPDTTNLEDEESLLRGLAFAYGDSADLDACVIHDPPCTPGAWPRGWQSMKRKVEEIWDPATLVSDASRFYGNKAHADADAFMQEHEWNAALSTDHEPVTEKDAVVLGFDGSRHRKKGVTDATALVAMRVSDGLAWPVGVWEQPDTAAGRDWEPPEAEIEQTLHEFMESHHVVGFYADPTLWESNVAGWEAKYGARLKVGLKAHPIAWRTSQVRRTVVALETLRNGLLDGTVRHAGNAALTRHVLNARLRQTRHGLLIYKEFPDSPRKIDAAYCLMLANQARVDALAVGDLDPTPKRRVYAPRRIR